MDTLLEQYGRTILYAFVGLIALTGVVTLTMTTNNPVSKKISDNFYERDTEMTNAGNLSLVHPTITLKQSSYTTNSGNIHIYPEYSGIHNFKDDIVLTDNGATIPSSNVHYRIMSVNLRNNNETDNAIKQDNASGKPEEGYYMIKYWYRSPANNTVATFITTVVVHNKY